MMKKHWKQYYLLFLLKDLDYLLETRQVPTLLLFNGLKELKHSAEF